MNWVNREVMLIYYYHRLKILMNLVVGDRGAKSTQSGIDVNLLLLQSKHFNEFGKI